MYSEGVSLLWLMDFWTGNMRSKHVFLFGDIFPPRGKVTQQDFFLRRCSAAKRVGGMVTFKAPNIEPKVFCFRPHFEEQTSLILGTETEVNKGLSFVLAVWVISWRLGLLQKGYQKGLHVFSKFWMSKRQHFQGGFGGSRLNKTFVFSGHVSNGPENMAKR